MSLSVSGTVSDDVDLFGKVASDLQADVRFNSDNTVTGMLDYVEDYTGFSSNPDEQQGNYLVFHAEVPGMPEAQISVTLTKTSVLDEDGIGVFRIADKSSRKLKFVVSADGYSDYEREYDLSNLTLMENSNLNSDDISDIFDEEDPTPNNGN